MKTFCEDCGSAVYSGRCTNCHEELYILDQYIDQGMELPSEDTEFMKKVSHQLIITNGKEPRDAR